MQTAILMISFTSRAAISGRLLPLISSTQAQPASIAKPEGIVEMFRNRTISIISLTDLEFEFNRPPCLQLAFAYGYLPGIESAQANGIPRQRVEKRLRIHTVQLGMATDFASLYKGADAETISCLLTHKVITFKILAQQTQ